MSTDNPLPFLRALSEGRRVPPVILLAGPQAFLREYILDALRARLAGEGVGYGSFQVGASGDFSRVIEELVEPGLFASRKLIACRVLRSRRERAGESAEPVAKNSDGAADEGALVHAIGQLKGPSHLVLLYENAAPAKLRQAIEKDGVVVNCAKPFDNQIVQFAQAFARALGLKLSSAAIELLAARYGADLAAMNNALNKLAIGYEPGETIEASQLREPAAQGVPEVFELAESLTRGQAGRAFSLLERSLTVGRDPFELLAVEIIPVLRRILLGASMLRKKDSTPAEIARQLGLSPTSPLLTRALDAARRFGFERVALAYRTAAELDAGFKMGLLKGREQALSGLVLELLAGPPA